MSDEWGPWVEHDQSSVPSEVLGRFIEVDCMHPNGHIDRDAFWHPADLDDDWRNVWSVGFNSIKTGVPLVAILRYRIRNPSTDAAVEALKALAAASGADNPKRKVKEAMR